MEIPELTREHCLVGIGLDAREQQFLGLEKTLLAGQGHRHAPVPHAGFRDQRDTDNDYRDLITKTH